ncbi:MAG TPA: hypothetical protein VL593_02255 [Ramlibacter sp.]|jgi:hypothetical protein|nr:hypothetical protein [Ramlibacter sp.]
MSKSAIIIALAAAGALGLTGCDVKKVQEGKYEVTTPDVKVGKTTKEVEVPKTVETEKKNVTVPTLDVKTAREKEQEKSQKSMGSSGTSDTSK